MPEEGKRRARLRRYFAIELRHMALPRGQVWTRSDLTGAAPSTATRCLARATSCHPP